MKQGKKSNTSPILHDSRSIEDREDVMIALAMDVAEERLRNGTATSQEVVHFLRLGSTRARAEAEKLKKETALLEAKAVAIESSQKSEELYSNAIAAFRSYSGQTVEDEDY